MNNFEGPHFHGAESFHTYMMVKYKNSEQPSEAAFSDPANSAFRTELHVFLTPQGNTVSFPHESTFLLHPTTCNACLSCLWSCLPAWIITKKSQLATPFSLEFMTSDSNT